MTTLPTPLQEAPPEVFGSRTVLLKREDVHELGAFKWRGALPTLAEFARDGAAGVVTASTGNHGAAAAWAALELGLEAIVFTPEGASSAKLALLEGLQATVRQLGTDVDEAKDLGRAWADEHGLPFFEDGAEPAQLEGYARIADEVLAQLEEPPAAVVVPVGNGALLGGIGRRLAERAPDTMRVGVVAKEAPVMADSWADGRPLISDRCATFADGLAVRVAIPFAVDVLSTAAQRMLRVSEREIARGVGALHAAGIRAEGAAGAAVAALSQLDVDGPIVVVVTGRNIDDDVLARVLENPGSFPD